MIPGSKEENHNCHVLILPKDLRYISESVPYEHFNTACEKNLFTVIEVLNAKLCIHESRHEHLLVVKPFAFATNIKSIMLDLRRGKLKIKTTGFFLNFYYSR